jgi:hypothetical protein
MANCEELNPYMLDARSLTIPYCKYRFGRAAMLSSSDYAGLFVITAGSGD